MRTASEVIDKAIAENRVAEWLMYLFALIFVSTGGYVLVVSLNSKDVVTSLIGLNTSSLFWPAMTSARRTRKENIAIRLLEAPMNRADTAKDASDMLYQLMDDLMRDNTKDG